MASLMMKSVLSDAPMPLIDLGYATEDATKERYDALRVWGIPRSRFSIEGNGRLLLEPAKTKLGALLAAFPILRGTTYWRTTHHWQGLDPADSGGDPQASEEGR